MLKITKWLNHDPFRLTFDFAIDDISCLEEIGNVVLKYDDDEEDDEDDFDEDDDEDDDGGNFGWGFDSDLDDDDEETDDDDEEDDEEDDEGDYEDMLIRSSDRWVVCEDDHYGETDSETEDAKTVS